MGNNLVLSNIFRTFEGWIGGTCKPSDKGMLTAFPRFQFCQQKVNKNVSNMLRFEDLPEINSPRWLSLEDFEGEEWRDVVGYEKRFQISNYGRLKRKNVLSYNPHNKSYCNYKEKIFRQPANKRNYRHVCLCVGANKKVNFTIHRAVMEAFVENPNNLPFINHKDENPSNNCLYNLEWCTPCYNANYGNRNIKVRQKRIDGEYVKPVVLYSYDGDILKEYDTAKDAAKDNNISRTLVVDCCDGIISHAKDLHFRYKGEPYIKRDIKRAKYEYTVYKEGRLLFKTKEVGILCRRLDLCYSAFRRLITGEAKTYSKLAEYTIFVRNPYKDTRIVIKNGKVIQADGKGSDAGGGGAHREGR